jgi:hypothetical protein
MAWPSTSSPSSPGIFLDHPAPPRASSASGATTSSFVVGGSRIICLADDQVPSRRSAARRRDKAIIIPPAVFLSSVFPPSSASSTAASHATQRPGPIRPRDPVDLHLRGPAGHHPQYRVLPANLPGPTPWPHQTPFWGVPLFQRRPHSPVPSVSLHVPDQKSVPHRHQYLSSCNVFRPLPPQSRLGGNAPLHIGHGIKPWQQPILAPGGSSAKWLPTRGSPFLQQKLGGIISRLLRIPREDVWTSKWSTMYGERTGN